jgi:epsilon-lactone hydrolase
MTQTETERDGCLAVGPRTIPSPRSISLEARTSLARLIDADGTPLNAAYPLPAPDDRDGWVRLQTAAGAQYAASMRRLSGELRSSVETIRVGSALVHVATPADAGRSEGAFVDLHGGALVLGGGEACMIGARTQADQHGLRCYGVDYRMPPEHPYPAALDDCVAAYRHVVEMHDPAGVIVGGRSAGGNLAVSMLVRARDLGLPMPAGLVLLSPEVDLTESGDSFETNRMVDVVLPVSLMPANADPLLSPLFADLRGLPPTLLQSGTRDLLLSNTVRMHRALLRVGVAAELHVFEAMPHGGFGGGTPEDAELSELVARFVRARIDR